MKNIGLKVSETGLGCWTLGGLNWEENRFSNGWSQVDIREAKKAIHYAIDNGVNHFDNADVYGNGAAERLLGDALGKSNSNILISSKVGWFSGTALHPYEPLHIRRQCEQSLVNLKRDHIDIYYFHHGKFGTNDCYLESACETMEKLKAEGKIRFIGLSAYSEKDFKRLIPKIRPTVVQTWAHVMDYHFIVPNSSLMRLCKKNKIMFFAFSPLNQGILLGKYSSNNPPKFLNGDHRRHSEKFRAPYLIKAEKGLLKIKEKFGKKREDLVRVALQFILYHDNVSGVITGFRNLEQVRMHIAASGQCLNGEEIAFIRKAFT